MKPFYKNSFLKIFNFFNHFLIFCLFFCYFSTFITLFYNRNDVQAEITYFAKVTENNTYLYSYADETSPLFILPQTYFVELFGYSDNKDYYYAKYNDIYGYVKKELVKPVKTVPLNPYLTNISFRVFVPSGANLRSNPENLGATNLVCSIPFLETNLLYYGEINGEEAISKKGTKWYYCKYYMNNNSYFGYIYMPLTDCLGTISENTEVVEFIYGELKFKQESINASTQNTMEGLSPTTQTIIIVAISLPCLLFVYLLFKPTQIAETAAKKSKHNKKQKISKLKHSDYYEYDDDYM